MPSTRRRSGFRRGPKPKTMWFDNAVLPATVLVGAQASADLMTVGLPAGLVGGYTILRTIANVYMLITGASSTDGTFALHTGQTAPGPLNQPSTLTAQVDWYWHQSWYLFEVNVQKQFSVDLHTGRKIRGEDRTLWFTINNRAGVTVTFYAGFRFLLQRS